MIDVSHLSAELESSTPPLVLDVRLADDFAAGHVPGAMNNAVFEVAFHERLPLQIPDQSTAIRIYGASSSSLEARMALEKLERAGFSDVAELDGGFEAWQFAGMPVVAKTPLPASPALPDGPLEIDLESSRVGWTGRNLLNNHGGCVALKSGQLDFDQGRLTGGEMVLDMLRLDCSDLAGSPHHDVLIRHLHDHDFFDVALFPEARLVITSAAPLAGSGPGAANLRVTADLTIKGQTHAIEFDAASGLTPEGQVAAQAVFSIDRTKWGVLYGSGKFFHRLAGHLVNDLVHFEVKIVTR